MHECKDHICAGDYKLITLIIPGHKSLGILKGLVEDKNIITGNKTNARGMSNNRDAEDMEMEVLTVSVEGEQADDIFAYLYDKAELYKPDTGLIFQTPIVKTTEYNLDTDIPSQE